jgi:hypothetical protein
MMVSEIEGSLAIRALIELLNDLNERDVVAGVLQYRYPSGFTGAAMALEQYGLWPRAQEELYNAIRSIHEPGSANTLLLSTLFTNFFTFLYLLLVCYSPPLILYEVI